VESGARPATAVRQRRQHGPTVGGGATHESSRASGSSEGFWLDSSDYQRLRNDLLDPLRPGGSGRYRCAAHHVRTDEILNRPWQHAARDAILILDGLFLHRDELVDLRDVSVFLEVPFAVSVARMAIRDGTHPDPGHPSLARYVEGQRRYFAACSPWQRADLVIDNADWAHPSVLSSPRAIQDYGTRAGWVPAAGTC
jgi:uridine kinase